MRLNQRCISKHKPDDAVPAPIAPDWPLRLPQENMVASMEKMARGFVKPVIDTEIEFGDLETALDRMESRQVFGKIIMRMG